METDIPELVEEETDKVPVTIITGFLGAGKVCKITLFHKFVDVNK